MMKNYLFILPVFAALSFITAPAMAADDMAAAPTPHHHADSKKHEEKSGKDFKSVQSARLKKIDAHIAKLKKARNCISSATDKKSLDACLPKKSHHAKSGSTHQKSTDSSSHHEHHEDDMQSGQ